MSNAPNTPEHPYRTAPPIPPETFWSTVRRIGSSRKGVAAIIVTIIVSIYALALSVSYLRGQMNVDVYWTKLGAAGAVITAIWWKYQGATAEEDSARFAASAPRVPLVGAIASGDGAKATSTSGGAEARIAPQPDTQVGTGAGDLIHDSSHNIPPRAG
jgi:hypothetical protein